MATTGEPLSDARLAEIREFIAHGYYTGDEEDAYHNTRALLAEVERLREVLNRVSVAYMREVQRNRPDAPGRE